MTDRDRRRRGSRVGIGSGIAAGDAYGQPLEVEVPAGPVVVALLVRGEVVVAQDDPGAFRH